MRSTKEGDNLKKMEEKHFHMGTPQYSQKTQWYLLLVQLTYSVHFETFLLGKQSKRGKYGFVIECCATNLGLPSLATVLLVSPVVRLPGSAGAQQSNVFWTTSQATLDVRL